MVIDLGNIFVADGSVVPLDLDFDFADVEYLDVYPFKENASFKGNISNRAGVVTLEGCFDAVIQRRVTDAVKFVRSLFALILNIRWFSALRTTMKKTGLLSFPTNNLILTKLFYLT